jgi:hypothetical protein
MHHECLSLPCVALTSPRRKKKEDVLLSLTFPDRLGAVRTAFSPAKALFYYS